MKNLILFLAVMMSFQLVFGSVLVVNLPKGNFKVVIDGSVYHPYHSLRLDHVHPGSKKITIFREGYNNYGQPTCRTLYDGCIQVPSQSQVVARFHQGNLHVQTTYNGNYGNPCGSCGQFHDGQSCQYGNGGYNGPGHGNNGHNHHNNACGNCGRNHQGGNCGNNGYNNSTNCEYIIQLMYEESFDSNRLSLGLNFVRSHRPSAQDITRMAALFTFDSNRLNFAKQAYAFCANPQDYYMVTSTFTFSSNKQALLKYIGQ